MRKSLAIFVCVFALTAWAVAQVGGKQAERITNGPVVEGVGSHSAVIAWSTNTGGSSVVKYGTDPNNLNKTETEPYHMGHGTHRVEIKNLQPGTTYYFKVISGHGQGTGTEAESPVAQFTTSGAGGQGGRASAGQAPASGQASQAPLPGQVMSGSAPSSGTKLPLYRALNPSTGVHLFTHSHAEEQNAIRTLGYKDEGIAGYIMKSQTAGTQPLFRLLGPNGDHFYTSNENEKSQAASHGYKDEGVAGYVATTQQPDTVPLYRMVNQKGEHFYTSNPSEHQQNLSQGWRDEGIAGYIWPS